MIITKTKKHQNQEKTKMTMFRYHWDKFHDIRAFEKLNLLKWFIKSKVFKRGSNIFIIINDKRKRTDNQS